MARSSRLRGDRHRENDPAAPRLSDSLRRSFSSLFCCWPGPGAKAITNQSDISGVDLAQQGPLPMTAAPRIKTTVVGSYPAPEWLLALPSEQALIDATRVVIHTQEQAG